MSGIGIIATLRVQPDKEAEFEAVFAELAPAVRANEAVMRCGKEAVPSEAYGIRPGAARARSYERALALQADERDHGMISSSAIFSFSRTKK